jgi:hypothetical protein
MKPVLQCVVVLAVVLIGVPGYTAERLAPYDDFNTTHLNPDKWFGGEYSPAFPNASTEAIRQLQDHRLRLVYRSYGQTDADSGRLRSELVLMFRNPAAVTAIEATVQVTDMATTDCPGNPESTEIWANLGGRFFGSPPSTSEGEVRDMVAFIGIVGMSGATGPPDVLQARAIVFLCANRPCTAGMQLHRRDLGPVKRGESTRLRVRWDQDKHQFIFQRDDVPEVFAPYAVSDTAPPGIAVKLLDAMLFVPKCAAMPRPMAFIVAWFDDVMVNESAAPRAER